MRVSTNQYHLNSIRNIQQGTAEYNKFSTQLATGKRIAKPSDDPLGSVTLLTLNAELTALKQYKGNMDAVHYNLGSQETQLGGIVHLLLSLQDLVTTAADGSMGQEELQALSQEMRVLFPAIVDLLNARDGSGRYYFSGSQSDVMPFQKDALGQYQYLGDERVREVRVTDNSALASNILGSNLAPDADFLNQFENYLALFDPVAPAAGAGDESRQMMQQIGIFLGHVTGEITRIGGIRAALDNIQMGNEEIALFTENLRDEINAVDFPEAYIRMNEAMASYESSLKVYSSVSRMSLFSYF